MSSKKKKQFIANLLPNSNFRNALDLIADDDFSMKTIVSCVLTTVTLAKHAGKNSN